MKKILTASFAIVTLCVIVVACNRKATAAANEQAAAQAAFLEAGKTIYNGKCVKCHNAKPVENWNADQWKPILKSMVRKAKLDSLEIAQVSGWVYANCKK